MSRSTAVSGYPRHAVFPRHHLRPTVAALLALSAMLALSACGGGSSGDGGGTSAGGKAIAVTLSGAGCSPNHLDVKAGPVSLEVLPDPTGKVSELRLSEGPNAVLAEAAHVVGPAKGRFSLDLTAGEYTLTCPGGDQEEGSLTVAGDAPTPTLNAGVRSMLAQAVRAYEAYVASEATTLNSGTGLFVAALRAGETARAKELFAPVRSHYQSIEPAANMFAKLADEIDQSASGSGRQSGLIGFHRIEQVLWQTNGTEGTANVSSLLLQEVETLMRRLQTLQLQPAQLANNAAALVREMAAGKLGGQEDRYSHTDLSDLNANLSGARKAFALLVPALHRLGQSSVVQEIETGFTAVARELSTYKRDTPLGFVPFDRLGASARTRLASRAEALYEPLAHVAALVSGAS
jgi:iron uptake system component EfeO